MNFKLNKDGTLIYNGDGGEEHAVAQTGDSDGVAGFSDDPEQRLRYTTLLLVSPALLRELSIAYRELVRQGVDRQHPRMRRIRALINVAKGK